MWCSCSVFIDFSLQQKFFLKTTIWLWIYFPWQLLTTVSWKGMFGRRHTMHWLRWKWGSALEIQTTKPAHAIWTMLAQSSAYFPDLDIRFQFVCFISMHADLLQVNRLHLSTGNMQLWSLRQSNIYMFTFSDEAQIVSRWNLNANIWKYDPTQTNPNK